MIRILLCALALGCAPGHAILAGAFLVTGAATRHEDVVPSWRTEWPELPPHRHVESRERETMLRHVWRLK